MIEICGVLQHGIPFDVKLPQTKPIAFGALTSEQFDAEIEKGLHNLRAGRVSSADDVAERMQQDFGM